MGRAKEIIVKVIPSSIANEFVKKHHLKISSEFRKWDAFEGKQLKYVYLIDKSCKITVPVMPFSKIDEMGAGMYKGKKISLAERKALNKSGEVESNANFNQE